MFRFIHTKKEEKLHVKERENGWGVNKGPGLKKEHVTVKKVGYMGGTKGIYIGMRPHFTFPRESTFHPFSPTPTTRRAASTYAHHHSSSSTRTRSELRHVRVYVL
jgi:hypothetical protein